jgi:hypothetical protein
VREGTRVLVGVCVGTGVLVGVWEGTVVLVGVWVGGASVLVGVGVGMGGAVTDGRGGDGVTGMGEGPTVCGRLGGLQADTAATRRMTQKRDLAFIRQKHPCRYPVAAL